MHTVVLSGPNKGAEYIATLNSSLQRHYLTVAEAVT